MYVQLPVQLLQFVFPKLYFPYFGSLDTATTATFAINCGPPEAEFDSLGTANYDWDVSRSQDDTDRLILDPLLVDRPRHYFRFSRADTPVGLGHPKLTGNFWSFFNCAGPPQENPLHRTHYFEGTLVHIDGVPWATRQRWGAFGRSHPVEAATMAELALHSLHSTLANCPNLERIFVRGSTASEFLEATDFGLKLDWQGLGDGYLIGRGNLKLGDGRMVAVTAVNQFRAITAEIAQQLIA